MSAPPPEKRAIYMHFLSIPTRWMDNDVYGHVNNVVYYSYFDTVINRYLVDEGGLDIAASAVIGLSVESHCQSSAAAQGWFVHVFVDRETRKPSEIPERIRAALSRLGVARA